MSFRLLVYKVASEKTYKLFVYGTLMKNGEAHEQLSGAKFLGKHKTSPKYQMEELGNDFHAITNGLESIPGELYELDSDLMNKIDNWEYSIYTRKTIELEDGSKVFSYIL